MKPLVPAHLLRSVSSGHRTVVCSLVLMGVMALTACSSKPPTPDWQMNAQGAAQKATDAYLSGNTRVEQLEWDNARAQVSRTGRADLLARLELMRCAAQVASLEVQRCDHFEPLRQDAAAPEQAYADYLAGRVQAQQIPLLPEPQRKPAAGDVAALKSIKDPLSRLVAAGVLFKAGSADPEVIDLAMNTASAQGWRRPLLAWLAVQIKRAESSGQIETAAALRRRMAIVEGTR